MAAECRALLVSLLMLVCTAAPDIFDRPSIIPKGTFLVGSMMVLTCVEGKSSLLPADSILFEWRKDSVPIANASERILLILNLSVADDGRYTCRIVKKSSGEGSSVSDLYTVEVLVPPTVHIDPMAPNSTFVVTEGNNLTLTCTASNAATSRLRVRSYRWTYSSMSGGQEIILTEGSRTLTIDHARGSKSGQYSCWASNDLYATMDTTGTKSTVTAHVLYLDSMLALTPEVWQTLVVGENVTLTCRADSVPTASLTWLHQGKILRTVEGNEDVFSFTATGCQDSGEFQCRATNEAVKKSTLAETRLTVECPPTVLGNVSLVISVQGQVGQNVTLAVPAAANPSAVFHWSGPNRQRRLTDSDTLVIVNFQPEDAGHYSVNMSNVHGWIVQNFSVVIKGVSNHTEVWQAVWMAPVAALFCLVLVLMAIIVPVMLRRRKHRQKSSTREYDSVYVADPGDRSGEDHSGRKGRRRNYRYSGESADLYCSIHSEDLMQLHIAQPQPLSVSGEPSRGVDESTRFKAGTFPPTSRRPRSHGRCAEFAVPPVLRGVPKADPPYDVPTQAVRAALQTSRGNAYVEEHRVVMMQRPPLTSPRAETHHPSAVRALTGSDVTWTRAKGADSLGVCSHSTRMTGSDTHERMGPLLFREPEEDPYLHPCVMMQH